MKKIIYYISLPFLYGISLLPFWLLYIISDGLFLILYHLIGYRKLVVMENLKNAFPKKTDKERKNIAVEYYHNLCDIMVEVIKMMSISKKTFSERCTFTNPELAEYYFKQERSIVVMVGHMGNWEWGCLLIGATSSKPALVVYKPLNNPFFNRLFNKMRSRTGTIMVSMKNTLRKMVEFRKQAFIAVFAGDQTPVKRESVFWTFFLNQETSVFLGAEKIAKLNNSVVFYSSIKRLGRGKYECTYHLLFENPKETKDHEITLAYLKKLEKDIGKDPAYWLWSHRRWKHKRSN